MTENPLESLNTSDGQTISQPSATTTKSVPMKLLTIKRVALLSDKTFGVLFDEQIPFCLTIERAWLNNKKGESCIPKGEYTCRRLISPKFGETFEVTGVPNRDAILIHKGNVAEDSHGCIILGEQYEPIGSAYGVAASGAAFSEFYKRLKGCDECKLVILEV